MPAEVGAGLFRCEFGGSGSMYVSELTGLSKKYSGSCVGLKTDAGVERADLGSLRAEGWDEPQSDG